MAKQLGGPVHAGALELPAERRAAHLGQRALELAAARGDLVGHLRQRQVRVGVVEANHLERLAIEFTPCAAPWDGRTLWEYGRSRSMDHRLNWRVWGGGPLGDEQLRGHRRPRRLRFTTPPAHVGAKVGAAVVIDPEQPGPGHHHRAGRAPVGGKRSGPEHRAGPRPPLRRRSPLAHPGTGSAAQNRGLERLSRGGSPNTWWWWTAARWSACSRCATSCAAGWRTARRRRYRATRRAARRLEPERLMLERQLGGSPAWVWRIQLADRDCLLPS